MKTLLVQSDLGDSRVFVEASLKNIRAFLDSAPSVVITDTNVGRLCGPLLAAARVVQIEPGEAHKNLKTAGLLYRKLLQLGVDRSTFLWGLGGGVVCDLTGFVASTFLRGIPFGFIPTTLLAQVDASIGGKNGVNLDGYKNLVGVFAQPRCVVLNFDVLRTLSEADILCGLAEVVKYGLIKREGFFQFVESNWRGLVRLEPKVLRRAVVESIRVKAGIVRADARESHERKKLNFGHTLGHALEKECGLPHGQAVAAGMAFAVRLSVSRGLLPRAAGRRVERLLRKIRRPAPIAVRAALLMTAIQKDKKRFGPQVDFVLLEKIGKARVVEMPLQELEEFLNDLCQYC